ncbi:RagB/SusD family nutrient uptake outer membrane protein [Chitinophaga pendula]|uniref:RagB/SusD family nutrient uptake outer membrane protein n=1 Tax=Chitinophaga TaxID=79328 RepID=UPI0018DF42BB|nr:MULTISPECIES: RagB/SusD family nutrient uptake outer membrane protein [Chitinophaga]UCJ06546.1 RagB/SusD family nutrient uptake outer membrane protein [Chitinophaga pendula]
MKYLKYILVAGLAIGSAACEKPLEETPYSVIPGEQAYNTKADADAAVIGMYAALYPNYWMYYGGYHMVVTDMTTPMGYNTPGGDLKQMVDFAWSPANQYLQNEWRHMWSLVFRANLALEKLPGIGALDEAVKKEYLGHARFLRALGYYDLTSLWGDVPLVLRSNIGGTAKPHRNKQAMVEAQIIEDLVAAAAALPAKQPSNREAWATQGAAYGLLCKIYLRQKNYAKVEEYARKIMATGRYDLFQPQTEGANKLYSDLFLESNKRDNEFIYKIMYAPTEDGLNGMGVHNRPTDLDQFEGYAYYGVSLDFWWTFEDSDPRGKCFLSEYTGITGKQYRAPKQGETLPTNIAPMPAVYSKKFFVEKGKDPNFDGHNMPILRYADILLCLAEAINEQTGPSAEAIELVNQIKRRAGATELPTSGFSKETLRDKIFQERGWELVFEMKHREDLMRRGTYVEACNKYIAARKSRGALGLANVGPEKLYFPVPQEEVNANPNITQPPIDVIEFPAIK